MRDHEQFEVANKFGESKSEEQSRYANEALGRAARGNHINTATGMPIDDHTSFEYTPPGTQTTDAVLNWASGNHTISKGIGDVPLTSEIARTAGIAGPGLERISEDEPAKFGLTSVPDCSEGNMNVADIFRGGK